MDFLPVENYIDSGIWKIRLTPEKITEKQRNLIQNIQRLADMEDPEFTDFWQLLGYHDAITPEIQRVALASEVFWPCEIYYHAPADCGMV